MGDLVVKRWTRYGHDRLYVTTSDGAKVGWHDLKTGESHLEVPDLADEFTVSVACFQGDPVLPVLPPPSAASLIQPDQPAEDAAAAPEQLGDFDLALNRPGQGVREKANEQAAADRERSTLGYVLNRLTDRKTEERAWRVGALAVRGARDPAGNQRSGLSHRPRRGCC